MNSHPRLETRWRWAKAIEGPALVLLLVLKLWMVSELDIVAVASPHDNQWMINKAAVCYWGESAYNQLTNIKEPLMPLFLAFSRALGIPARLGLEIFLAFSAWMLCRAVPIKTRTGSALALRILLFSAVLFFPPTVPVFCATVADPLTICLSVLWLGFAVRILANPATEIPWMLLAGWALVSVGLASARPEIEWVEGALLAGFLCWLGLSWAVPLPKGFLWKRVAAVLVTWLLFMIGVTGVKAVNYFKAGFWGISEQTEPNFRRALMALRSVPSGTSSRYVWINNPTLKRVAKVSPAVAEVQPFLTGPLMEWGKYVPLENRTDADAIAPGFFLWALRDAVFMAGRGDSAGNAASFYRRLADEISGAQKAGMLPRQSSMQYYLGTDPGPRIGIALRSFARFLAHGFMPCFPRGIDSVKDPSGLDPETLQEFDEVAGRRMYSATAAVSRMPRTIRGWFMETGSGRRLKAVSWGSANRVGPLDRPDVGKAYGRSGSNQFWGFLLNCDADLKSGEVVFVDEDGRDYPIDGNSLCAKKPGAGFPLTSRDGASAALCWIDSSPASNGRWTDYYLSIQSRNQKFWRLVERAWPWLIGAAAVAAGLSLCRAGQQARIRMLAVSLLGLSFVVLRYAILTVLDVWYVSAHELRYSSPADILALPLLLLVVSLAVASPADTNQVSNAR